MCLRPVKILNQAYFADMEGSFRKGYSIDNYGRPRPSYMYVPCRRCSECLNSRLGMYRDKTIYEIMSNLESCHILFTTLTVADDVGLSDDPSIMQAQLSSAFRAFIEALRYRCKNTPRYIFIPEYEGTRIHFHGFLFFDKTKPAQVEFYNKILADRTRETLGNHRPPRRGYWSPLLLSLWRIGIVHIGDSVSMKTAFYSTKYFTKLKPGFTDVKPFYVYHSKLFGSFSRLYTFEQFEKVYEHFNKLLSDETFSEIERCTACGTLYKLNSRIVLQVDSGDFTSLVRIRPSFNDFISILQQSLVSDNIQTYFHLRYGMLLDLLDENVHQYKLHNSFNIVSRTNVIAKIPSSKIPVCSLLGYTSYIEQFSKFPDVEFTPLSRSDTAFSLFFL